MSRLRKVAPPCCPLELSALHELYRGKLTRSITNTLCEIDDIWNTYISGQNSLSRVRIVAPPCSLLSYLP